MKYEEKGNRPRWWERALIWPRPLGPLYLLLIVLLFVGLHHFFKAPDSSVHVDTFAERGHGLSTHPSLGLHWKRDPVHWPSVPGTYCCTVSVDSTGQQVLECGTVKRMGVSRDDCPIELEYDGAGGVNHVVSFWPQDTVKRGNY